MKTPRHLLPSLLLSATALLSACQSSNHAMKSDDLLVRAESGDATAQFELGNRYDAPDNSSSPESIQQALVWYERAAAQGHMKAAEHAGYVLLNGLAGEPDHARAMKWLIPASDAGQTWATELIANSHLRGQGVPGDPAQAFTWFERAAAQGSAEALFRLGYACANGQGAPRDEARAVFWFLQGAEKGNSPSRACLGMMAWSGRGMPQDYAVARSWFEQAIASKGGNTWAPFMLGFMSENGHGTVRDMKQAAAYYQQAATGGYYQAKIRHALLANEIPPVELKWLVRNADRGSPVDQFLLGLVYQQGLGVPQNDEDALVWLELAATNPDYRMTAAHEAALRLRKQLPPDALRKADERIRTLSEQFRQTPINLF